MIPTDCEIATHGTIRRYHYFFGTQLKLTRFIKIRKEKLVDIHGKSAIIKDIMISRIVEVQSTEQSVDILYNL